MSLELQGKTLFRSPMSLKEKEEKQYKLNNFLGKKMTIP
jgi:hypothetical protein